MDEQMSIDVPVTDIVIENNSGAKSPPPFMASAILYVSSFMAICAGISIIMLDVLNRQPTSRSDTFIELLEWNSFSQMGLICIGLSMLHFWLGLMVDRRGA